MGHLRPGRRANRHVRLEQLEPGKVRKLREYTLTPGLAQVYNEGDIHAPSRSGPNRLVRIEGTNLEQVKRQRFEAV